MIFYRDTSSALVHSSTNGSILLTTTAVLFFSQKGARGPQGRRIARRDEGGREGEGEGTGEYHFSDEHLAETKYIPHTQYTVQSNNKTGRHGGEDADVP